MKIYHLQKLYQHTLKEIYSEAEIYKLFTFFAEEFLNYHSIQLKLHLHEELSPELNLKFEQALQALKSGAPYQQILGKSHFYGETFFVNENVLIPRPETEELIELALEKLPQNKKLKILDIGTGSGCIAITLAKHLKNATLYALDYSEKALEISKQNALLQGLDMHFIHGDYLNMQLSGNFDVMISNPPYIGVDEAPDIDKTVKDFEPDMALFAPPTDILAFYRKIANDSLSLLSQDGFIFLEINQKLGPETLDLFKNKLSEVYLLKDMSNHFRMIWGKK
ncbi:peptide chain release factor N(5)-glutamine methyltransferase [Elizabethkingia argentiflava]|uniref:peptide chain release factor N(5)-glutamine methyltransferase n=1 Tax=Elizabethkingia argenteiflava TaxID=2681556 RepID=A0A845PXC6_9FLAO|nr:peptide chain release factor N(5)-glutamine methyltransferase [Elizabethkingia argenteiflava]NAW51873.1 peptide chain release factor N(5)-glutamine methyltransferase [Elizabethkingia argenteiflava]